MVIYTGDSGGTTTKKPPYTSDLIAGALAANPGFGQSTAAPPPAAPNGGGGPTGGAPGGVTSQNPFETNPSYLAALAAEQAGSQQADAALRAAQEAAIVGYGDPSLAAALGFSVDENTAAAARQNYLAGNATLSRLDQQQQLAQQANINNLAAHGIIRSGELGYQTGQIGQRHGQAIYDAQQQLLSGLNAASAQDIATKQGLRGATTNALSGAYDLYVQNPQFYAGAATPPSSSGSAIPYAKAQLGSPSDATVAGQLGAPDVGQLVQSRAFGSGGAPRSRLAAPIRNAYTTGQKRYG